MACRTSGSSGVVAEWSRYTIGINSIGGSGRRGLLAQRTPADQLLDWPVEGLHVLVDVEHLVASDRPFLGCLGQTVWMLGFLEQEHRDEADAAVGAGDFNRAMTVGLVEELHLAISERLGAGEAFVVLAPLLDQSDQVHCFHYRRRLSGGQAADSKITRRAGRSGCRGRAGPSRRSRPAGHSRYRSGRRRFADSR